MSGRFAMIGQLERPRWVSAALIAFALIAVPIGIMDPHGRAQKASAEATLERHQMYRADAIAGFPVPPHSEKSPRGPDA